MTTGYGIPDLDIQVTLDELEKAGLINWKQKDSGFLCDFCLKGKQTAVPFPTGQSRRATNKLELVHTDVWGPAPMTSRGGTNYFILFIDDYTRRVWLYLMKSKDQAFSRFLEWKAAAERQSGRKRKALRSDNGGEFTSSEFTNDLKKEGIKHEWTVPGTPQQNGVVERMNRTVLEKARCLRLNAGLPLSFWSDAVVNAVYLINRLPQKANNGDTAIKVWRGRDSGVNHLRIFGCPAYYLIPTDKRKNKLEAKSQRMIFLGYPLYQKGLYAMTLLQRGR